MECFYFGGSRKIVTYLISFMEIYKQLVEKFLEKGYLLELHYFVLPPPLFQLGKILGTMEEQIIFFNEAVNKMYGSDWDYWNTWIDYQNYK